MVIHRRQFWLLQCCVSPQSEIARKRIDRAMISVPTNFRHVGHMGANDLSANACSLNAVQCLLKSKGDDKYSLPVPPDLRASDIPVEQLASPHCSSSQYRECISV